MSLPFFVPLLDFNIGEAGSYFTDSSYNSEYYYNKGKGNAYKVYLNLERPFVIDAGGRNFGIDVHGLCAS